MKEAQERARGCAPSPSLSCTVGGSTPVSSLLRCRCWRCRPRHDARDGGEHILDPTARPGSTSIGTSAAPKTMRARQRDPPFLHFPLGAGSNSVKPNVYIFTVAGNRRSRRNLHRSHHLCNEYTRSSRTTTVRPNPCGPIRADPDSCRSQDPCGPIRAVRSVRPDSCGPIRLCGIHAIRSKQPNPSDT